MARRKSNKTKVVKIKYSSHLDLDLTTREGRQKFYQTPEWRAARDEALNRRPLCPYCTTPTAATVVDHQIDIVDDPTLALAQKNLLPMCSSHHNKKTAGGTLDSSLSPSRKWSLDITPKPLTN